MKIKILIAMLASICAAAQVRAQVKIDLQDLAAKAAESVDVTLDSNLLQLAGKFLSVQKPDEAKAKELISGIKAISVKSFQFDKEGQYSPADLQPIRLQLQQPGWSRIVNVLSNRDREGAEIYVKTEAGKTAGLAILAYEPKQLTVVSIDGSIDLERLSELGGHFGIPKGLPVPPANKKGAK